MAAYNFPNSPADGDTVTSNGITYTYSSSKTRWDGAAPSGSSTTVYTTIDDLPLSGASTGDQAFVSGNNRLYIWNGTGWYNIALVNTNPSISGASATYNLATDGTATTVTITASDPEGIPITYSIASDTSGNVATVTQGTGSNTNVFTITPSTNTANAGTFSLTFRASDGVNIATAVSEFTLVFSVANSSYTTALITSVGANNATNNSIDDASTNNYTITANGDASQVTFSPYRHAGYSTYFDGTGDYLKASDHAGFDMGTGNFTIELWMYAGSQGGNYPGLVSSSNYNTAGSSSLRFDVTGNNDKLFLYCNSASPSADPLLTSSSALSLNAWHHVALVRDGTSLKFYVDGSENGSVTIPSGQTFDFSNGEFRVGRGFDVDGANAYFTGYISDLRIVKGTAVYTSAFTAPTERLTAVTNTSLLACHLPYIADGSTNDHSITVNGDVKTEPFSPYDNNGYTASDHGGSLSFDGTGDYLTAPSTAHFADFGTGDFTIDWWEYITGWPNQYFAIFHYGGLGDTGNFNAKFGFRYESSGTKIRIGRSGSYIDFTGLTTPLNVWRHCAMVRSGTSCTLYRDGKFESTITLSDNITQGNAQAIFGGAYFGGGGGGLNASSGNIADLRVVKGTAVYSHSGTPSRGDSVFTPPTAPLTAITNTSLLLNGTDAGIIDKSQAVNGIALKGNVKSSTAQTKYLTSSMYFDGTGDYIEIADTIGEFTNYSNATLEMWVYPTTSSGSQNLIEKFQPTSGPGWTLYTTSGTLNLQWYGGGTTNSSTAMTVNQWNHVAVVHHNGTRKIYVNGTGGTGVTFSSSVSTANPLRIGVRGTNGNFFTGYMSDIRIQLGIAVYTADFTPPTAALQG